MPIAPHPSIHKPHAHPPLSKTWQPNRQQMLLVKAATQPANIALSAWEKWKAAIDLDSLDEGSYQVLPRLYQRLNHFGVHDPLMLRLKGVYRHVWARNQVHLRSLGQVVEALQLQGINPCLLWGAAIVSQPNADQGIRRIDDTGLWVRFEEMPRALMILRQRGWVPTQTKCAEILRSQQHAVGLSHPNHPGFALHWHVLPECCAPAVETYLWENAVPVKLGDISTQSLNGVDQFWLSCLRATQWSPMPPFYWLVDAISLYQHPTAIAQTKPWQSAVHQASTHQWSWSLAQAMKTLTEISNSPDLAVGLDALQTNPYTFFERLEFVAKARKPSIFGSLPTLWFQYQHLAQRPSEADPIENFWQFLQHRWGISSPEQLSLHLGCQGLKRLQKVLQISPRLLKGEP